MANETHNKTPGYGTFLVVWGTVLVLTIAAAASGRLLNEGLWKSFPLFIALVKTVLIASFFMNLKYERGFFRVMVFVVLGVILILGLFLYTDVGYR